MYIKLKKSFNVWMKLKKMVGLLLKIKIMQNNRTILIETNNVK